MDTKKTAKILKALAHPQRLELFLEIMKNSEANFSDCGECFITDIIQSFNIGAPTISFHLKELSNAGLIFTERKGKFLTARINRAALDELKTLLTFPLN
ncbi:MAG: ArsR family transcriptional regulator [Desulfobacteraceae bacterium]|nr:MAG: ArsR family transcriptional regulator [Desulfobacteraceae bacterium]